MISPPNLFGVFERSRRFELEDGRQLVVQWSGERFGWSVHVPGDAKAPTLAATPIGAMALYVGPQSMPAWASEASERLMRELAECSRHACDCCGYLTLLNEGLYEICAVCGWEDDRSGNNRRDGGPDAPSGPNRISLSQARANFASFGASTERRLMFARDSRPEEVPAGR
jgi:hypothetical protein